MIFRPLLALLVMFGFLAVGAPSAEALSLNPPIFEFNVSPGDRIEDVIKVFNDSSEPITLKPEKVNFTAKADDEISGAPDFYPLDETRTGRELAPWIDIVDAEIGIEALTRQDFLFTITVPEDASPGSYFGGVILRSGQGAERGVGLVTGTAVLMLVKVEGDVVEQATLTDFGVASGFLTHLPARFHTRIMNEGTVHLQPTGTIEVRNMFGSVVASLPVNPGLRGVLPDSARRYETLWGQEDDADRSAFMRQWDGFRFGRYSAAVRMTYGADAKTLTGSTSFWIVPWMVIGAGFLGALALILVIQMFFAWYAKRVIARHRDSVT